MFPIICGARKEGIRLRHLTFPVDLYESSSGYRRRSPKGKWSHTAVRRIIRRHGIEQRSITVSYENHFYALMVLEVRLQTKVVLPFAISAGICDAKRSGANEVFLGIGYDGFLNIVGA